MTGPTAHQAERILVIKLAGLGDVLTATPALRALRNRFPSAEISALVTPLSAPLLEANDAVDQVILFPKALYDSGRALLQPRLGGEALVRALALGGRLRSRRFDTVVLLHHFVTAWGVLKYRALLAASGAPVRVGLDDGRGSFLTSAAVDRGFGAEHEVDYWLKVVGLLDAHHPDPRVELYLTPAELAEGERRWSNLGLDPRGTVVLHPGSGKFSVARRWAPNRFAAVGDELASDGLNVLLVAGPDEPDVAETVARGMRIAPALLQEVDSPRQLAAVLSPARLFIGNDSGVMHIAAAMDVPTVAVFGLTNHRAWGPYPPAAHRVVRLDLPCSPCFYHDFTMGTPEGCPPRTCLVELQPEAVLAAARELLAATETRAENAVE